MRHDFIVSFPRRLAGALVLAALAMVVPAYATTAEQAIEQALAAAKQSQRGIIVHLGGQSVSGAVVAIEPGQWVELRSQSFDRIVLRIARIDAVALP